LEGVVAGIRVINQDFVGLVLTGRRLLPQSVVVFHLFQLGSAESKPWRIYGGEYMKKEEERGRLTL